MIKSELVQKLADENPHLFQRDIENIVNAILDEVGDAMARGDRVELRGFGAFSVKNRPARVGRNPRTGETGRCGREIRAAVQGRQGNPRTDQPRWLIQSKPDGQTYCGLVRARAALRWH